MHVLHSLKLRLFRYAPLLCPNHSFSILPGKPFLLSLAFSGRLLLDHLFLLIFLEICVFIGTSELDLLFVFRTFLVLLRRSQLLNDPCQSKITNFDDQTLPVDENVRRLKIAMDDIGGVEIFESIFSEILPAKNLI